ncbi:MAG: ABC transporter permease, partial [Actinobacteria bacterium]|nr:ABC transporter permease [Actinomycetota bacterium]
MHRIIKKQFTEIVESMRMAMASLLANKMRAALTMLGIIIGVAAVITMVGLGNGAQKAIADRIQSLGSNLLFIRPGSSRFGRVHFGAGSRMTLKNKDAEALAEKCTTAQVVVPEFSRNAQVEFGANNWNCRIVGTTPDFAIARSFPTTEGRYFNDDEMA